MFKKIVYGIVSLFCLSSVAHAQSGIAFIGDSIAYGMGSSGPYINGGIVGAGIPTGNPDKNEIYWKQHIQSLTIVEIGTNDFRYQKHSYDHLLTQYILPFSQLSSVCIVQIPTPESKKPIIQKGVKNLQPVIQHWAMENHLKFVNFPDFNTSDRAPDGIHFKFGAYKRFSKELIDKYKT